MYLTNPLDSLATWDVQGAFLGSSSCGFQGSASLSIWSREKDLGSESPRTRLLTSRVQKHHCPNPGTSVSNFTASMRDVTKTNTAKSQMVENPRKAMKVPKPDTLKDLRTLSPRPGLCERAPATLHDLDERPTLVPRTECVYWVPKPSMTMCESTLAKM